MPRTLSSHNSILFQDYNLALSVANFTLTKVTAKLCENLQEHKEES